MKTSRLSLSTGEKVGLLNNLSTMLSAGIPILDAVESLMEDAKGNTHKVLSQLHSDLTQGQRVHVTFSKFPRAFDNVAVNLIKASEEAGTLATTLKDLKETTVRDQEFTDKVKSAFIYPALISLVFGGVLLMMLLVVIPKMAQVFERLNIVLPLPTRILIAVSTMLRENTIPLVGGITVAILVLVWAFKRYREVVMKPIYLLPGISSLIRDIDLTRFARSLHLLLSSGIPIATALDLSSKVVMRNDTAKLIADARDMVLSGKRLSEGFKKSKHVIPGVVVKLIEVGDKTGTLEQSMGEIAEFLDYEVSKRLKAITVLIEPLILIVVGVAVGGMMLAVIAPIYGIIGTVGAR